MRLFIILIAVGIAGCASGAYYANQQGITLAQNGNYSQAIAKFQQAIDEDPQSPTAYLNMAKTYLLQQQPQTALNPAQRAVDLAEDNLEARLLLLQIHLLLDNQTKAKQLEQSLRQQHPLEVHIMMGIIAFYRRDYAEAQLEWEKALALSPNDIFVHTALGLSAQHQKQYQQAAIYFSKLRKLAPDQIHPVMLQIFLDIAQKKHAQAVHTALTMSSQFPRLPSALVRAFAREPLRHIPWLISLLSHTEQPIVEFCGKTLAAITRQEYTIDQKYWHNWWQQQRNVLREFQQLTLSN